MCSTTQPSVSELVSAEVVVVAASGLAKEVISSLQDSQTVHVRGIVDDNPLLCGTSVLGVEVLGSVELLARMPGVQIVVCVGSGETRQRIVTRLAALGVDNDRYVTVIDPTVRVPEGCVVGNGSILLAQAALTADVRIGHHVVVMAQVTITHDGVIADFATLCAGVSLGGAVVVGAGAYLGMNASVRQHVRVGAGAVLGMGAVLLQDLPPYETWIGVPARPTGDHKVPVQSEPGSQTSCVRTGRKLRQTES